MKLGPRILAFVERNRGAILHGVVKQLLVKIWIRFRIWRFIPHGKILREPEIWVFMGGCYNSGTTVLREIISAHPEVASLPREGVEMTDAFPDLEAGGWARMWFRNAKAADLSGYNPLALAQKAKRDWSPWWRQGAKVFIEKSIVHAAWMPTLNSGFPNARFIGVIRNGYCVCEGIRRRAQPSGRAREALGRNDYPLDEIGRQWNFANQVLRRDRLVIENYHEVRYEEFTKNPLQTIRTLFEYIGVDSGVVKVLSDDLLQIGARKFKIVDKNAESLMQLDSTDRANLWSEIGPMMIELGYEEEAL